MRCTDEVEAWKLRDLRDVTLANESLRASRGGGANLIALALRLFELRLLEFSLLEFKSLEFKMLCRLIGWSELDFPRVDTASLPREFTGFDGADAGSGDTALGRGALLLRPLTLSSCVLEVLSESSWLVVPRFFSFPSSVPC